MTFRLGAILIAVLAISGLWLRWHGTDCGAPYGYHFDEPFIMKPALRMAASGDPNPGFFRYPSALIYMETAISLVHHKLTGMELTVPEGPSYGPSDLGEWSWPALLSGRRAVALLGAATVVAVAVAARAVAGPGAGMIAFALLAFMPLHVELSHYLTTDVPAACFLALAFALAVGAPVSRLWTVGVAIGVAIATKYTSAVALPGLFAVLLLRRSRPLALVMAAVSAVAMFLVLCPYSLLDWRLFLADIDGVREHYTSGHFGAEGNFNWGWYLRRLLDHGLGASGLAVLGCGLLASLWSVPQAWRERDEQGNLAYGRLVAAVITLTSLLWFGWLGAVTVRFERNLIPVLVLATIGGACGLASIVGAASSRWRRGGAILMIVLALAIVPVARMAVTATQRLGGGDTRARTTEWIRDHVPAGSYIVREEYGPRPDPQRYRVNYTWSAAHLEPQWYILNNIDYVIVSSAVYRRFLTDPAQRFPQIVERYREMLLWEQVLEQEPGPAEMGPTITVLRPPPVATIDPTTVKRGGARRP